MAIAACWTWSLSSNMPLQWGMQQQQQQQLLPQAQRRRACLLLLYRQAHLLLRKAPPIALTVTYSEVWSWTLHCARVGLL
jgi:hypothetical protein